MRHKNIRTRLNRETSNRMSMLNNMCVSLIKHEQIQTTLVKAKVLHRYVEPFITIAKNGNGDLASRFLYHSLLLSFQPLQHRDLSA